MFSQTRNNRRRNRHSNKKSTFQYIGELIILLLWLSFAGYTGYQLGFGDSSDLEIPCPIPEFQIPKVEPQSLITTTSEAKSSSLSCNENTHEGYHKEGGYTYSELKSRWTCSRVKLDNSAVHKNVNINHGSIQSTKWKSIITLDPYQFAKKYLPQYPSDTSISQPVILFSHKELKGIEELDDVCKVMDVAVVPDSEGTCVSVTETFHDVASYHMLHAERQKDGSYVLAANAVHDKDIPTIENYDNARKLLRDYFENRVAVEKIIKNKVPSSIEKLMDTNRVVDFIALLIESNEELLLFKNSLSTIKNGNIKLNNFLIFTSLAVVQKEFDSIGISVIFISELSNVGKDLMVQSNEMNNEYKKYAIRRSFIQSWLAFTLSDAGKQVLWQAPSTLYFSALSPILHDIRPTEFVWTYRGRQDAKAAPFYVSTDFFYASNKDRSTHLLHEVILHYDLVLAWYSLDTTISYRLSENNSRYGTTTSIIAPHDVLHADNMGRDVSKLKDAFNDVNDRPSVLVLPMDANGMSGVEQIELLKQLSFWTL